MFHEQAKTYTMDKNGFDGALYIAKGDAFDGKVLVLPATNPDQIRALAYEFVDMGLSCLVVDYGPVIYGYPLECFMHAIQVLKYYHYSRIGFYGFGKDGELALLLGSLCEDISCVIALSSLGYISCGLDEDKLIDGSPYSYNGIHLDYVKPEGNGFMSKVLSVLKGNYDTLNRYPLPEVDKFIDVQNIKGPILLIDSKLDSVWHSYESNLILMEKLKTHPYEDVHLSLDSVSHDLLPFDLKSSRRYKIERQQLGDCINQKIEAFETTMVFLKKHWL